jgi:glycosyltransferase involved in cell wall biosynthesis
MELSRKSVSQLGKRSVRIAVELAMQQASCVVVLLTFNSSAIVAETVKQAQAVSRHIYAVDSGSSDGTVDVLQRMGCKVVQRPFINYSDQRNWAIAQANVKAQWQLHLDADEVLDQQAIDEIRAILADEKAGSAYLLRRRDYFMGRMLRFSGLNPWHLRLFRSGVGQCEDRLYDQHFVTTVAAQRLKGYMHDRNATSLSEWIARHNRWSDLEAQQICTRHASAGSILSAKLGGDPRERRRWLKGVYYLMPVTLRALSYFLYRYFFCLGFLDGRVGFYFAFFQALWFRMLVDAKSGERQQIATK